MHPLASPTPREYSSLRRALGWPSVPDETVTDLLDRSFWSGVIRDPQGRVEGLARVIGDGALAFYIADVMVHPRCRGRRLGARLVNAATDAIRDVAQPGATVALIALRGRETFYEPFGFVRVPNAVFGQGMIWEEPLQGLVELES